MDKSSVQTFTPLSLKLEWIGGVRAVFGCCVLLQGESRGFRGRFGSPGGYGYYHLKGFGKNMEIRLFDAKSLWENAKILQFSVRI